MGYVGPSETVQRLEGYESAPADFIIHNSSDRQKICMAGQYSTGLG